MPNRRRIYTVSELTTLIKSTLEDTFPDIWVEGEICNFRMPSSGHLYFTLKDNSSQIKAVLFRSSSRILKFVPKDGIHVISRGRITIYEYRGEYQLIVDYMEPRGIGALLLAYEQLKTKLTKEGLFNEERKRPIPPLPRKIGIVTSPTGAAIRDILKVINRRFANIEILIAPATVQGDKAPSEIVEAIGSLSRMNDVDVIIVSRGGGGIEDLWPFNEEMVARAIYNSSVPVISAIGHETDYTIADFVADMRAPTPSAAAELVVKNKSDLQRDILVLRQRLMYGVETYIDKRMDKLDSLGKRVLNPGRQIKRYSQRLDEIEIRILLGVQKNLKEHIHLIDGLIKDLYSYKPGYHILLYKQKISDHTRHISKNISHLIALKKRLLQKAIGNLDNLSPLNILSRGYSITRKLPSLEVVKSYTDAEPGNRVDVRLFEGNLTCIVEDTSPSAKK